MSLGYFYEKWLSVKLIAFTDFVRIIKDQLAGAVSRPLSPVQVKIFNFLPYIFGHVGKRLDKKVKVNCKIMTPPTGKQIITMPIMSNISRSKDNQKIKFVQLVTCVVNIELVFLWTDFIIIW